MSKPTGYVILDQSTGNVVRSGVVPEGDVASQVVKPGQSALSTGDELISSAAKLDMNTGDYVLRAAAVPVVLTTSAMEDFVVGKRTYAVDRQRMVEVALVGGLLLTSDGPVTHTPTEGTAVLAAWVARRDAGVLPDVGPTVAG